MNISNSSSQVFFALFLISFFKVAGQDVDYRERVILQLNKEVYVPGEDLLFTAHVFEGQTTLPTQGSELLHVRLSNQQDELIYSGVLKLRQGQGSGSINLPDTLSQPVYKLIAFTNYMRNFPREAAFQKAIPVLSRTAIRSLRVEKDSRTEPISIRAYPNGGQLQVGRLNTVFFSAVDPTGEPLALSGDFIADQSDTLSSFYTDESGFGESTFVINRKFDRLRISAKVRGNIHTEDVTFSYSDQILSIKSDEDRFRIYVYDVADVKKKLKLRLLHDEVTIFETEIEAGKSGILVPFSKTSFPVGISVFELLSDNVVVSSQKVYQNSGIIEEVLLDLDSLSFSTSELAQIRLSIPVDSAKVTVSIKEYNETPFESHSDLWRQFLPNNLAITPESAEKWSQVIPNFFDDYSTRALKQKGYVMEKRNLAFQNIDLSNEGLLFASVQGPVPFFEYTEVGKSAGSGFALPLDYLGGKLWLSDLMGGIRGDFYDFKSNLDVQSTLTLMQKNLTQLEQYYQRLSENEFFEEKFAVQEEEISLRSGLQYFFPSPVAPETVHRFDDYITLVDFREALAEFLSELKFKKNRAGIIEPYVEKLSDEGIGIGLNDQPAFVFVNGVLTTNYDELLALKFRQIDSVEVYHKGLVYGGQEVGGIAAIYTKKPEELNYKLSSATPVDIPQLISEPDSESLNEVILMDNIPAFKEQVYWKSHLLIKNEEESIEFSLPDSRKPLLVEIYGFSKDGSVINYKRIIKNFWLSGLDVN